MFSGLDWFPTLLAAAGDTTVKERLLQGWQPEGIPVKFRNHLDGYNQLDYLPGKTQKGARDEFFYFDDDADLVGMRFGNFKAVFMEQRQPGGFDVWMDPLIPLRVPKIFNLRMDPFERANITSDQYNDWLFKNAYLIGIATMKASVFLETFIQYPPSQRPASFSVDQVRKRVDKAIDKHFEEMEQEKK
jgi:arylsulfatase A-like enzyme